MALPAVAVAIIWNDICVNSEDRYPSTENPRKIMPAIEAKSSAEVLFCDEMVRCGTGLVMTSLVRMFLLDQAQQCRLHAEALDDKPEAPPLLKMARIFDELATTPQTTILESAACHTREADAAAGPLP